MDKITIHNLAESTEQQVFDYIAAHLLNQNEKSIRVDDEETCVYKSKFGLTCAAGCLIPEENYRWELESNNWAYVVSVLIPEEKIKHTSLITHLQQLHDDSPVQEWPFGLSLIAREFKLNESIITNYKSHGV